MSDNCNNTITLKGNKKERANFLEGIQDTPVKVEGFVGISNVFDSTKEEFEFVGNNGGWFGEFGKDYVSFISASYPPIDALRVASIVFPNVLFYIDYSVRYQGFQGCAILFQGKYIAETSSNIFTKDYRIIPLDIGFDKIDIKDINPSQDLYKDYKLASQAKDYYDNNNYKEAFKILKLITVEKYSSPLALYLIGNIYEHGYSTLKNRKLAIHYYKLSAIQGNSNAMYHLGRILINKNNIEFNHEKGITLIKNAANFGHTQAVQYTYNLDKAFARKEYKKLNSNTWVFDIQDWIKSGLDHREEFYTKEELLELTHFPQVKYLDYYFKYVPKEIGYLSNLEKLELEFYEEGLFTLPKEIGNLRKLIHLYIRSENMKTLPNEIGNLRSLKELIIKAPDLTSIPKEIGNLSYLEKLSLQSNKLISLPEEICKLTKLKYIELSYITNINLTETQEIWLTKITGNEARELRFYEKKAYISSINPEEEIENFFV